MGEKNFKEEQELGWGPERGKCLDLVTYEVLSFSKKSCEIWNGKNKRQLLRHSSKEKEPVGGAQEGGQTECSGSPRRIPECGRSSLVLKRGV